MDLNNVMSHISGKVFNDNEGIVIYIWKVNYMLH